MLARLRLTKRIEERKDYNFMYPESKVHEHTVRLRELVQ